MNEPITFKTPAFIDDQLAGGRYIWPIPILSFIFGGNGSITIHNGILTYKESYFSSSPPKSFDLSKISKLLVVRTKYQRSAEDYNLFSLKTPRANFYLELFLIDKNEEEHILIPSFVDNSVFLSRRRWNNFLSKLKKFSYLPLETIEVTAK
jgi:hypothetical protein